MGTQILERPLPVRADHPPAVVQKSPDHSSARFVLPAGQLSDAMKSLLEAQKKGWNRLAEGYASLASIRQRSVKCTGFDVTLQFNPGRLTSTAAPVDADSVKRRPCFLCRENLPPEQSGLLYHNEFLVLCNPAPIFNAHFTITHVDHRPQELLSFFRPFLDLTREVSPAFSLFYNGPRCGASAPDHMHFQASPSGAIPIELEGESPRRQGERVRMKNTEIIALKDLGRAVFLLLGDDPANIEAVIGKLLAVLRIPGDKEEEPMVNVLSYYRNNRWGVLVFPRTRHRPEAFFREGDGRIVVSPAAVDMGGLIITPLEKDFTRLERNMIETIYTDVSPGPDFVRSVMGSL